jgi:hypothetical protein
MVRVRIRVGVAAVAGVEVKVRVRVPYLKQYQPLYRLMNAKIETTEK